jgi:hypothetical protein
LHFLVIDCPAFCAGVVIRGPKWPASFRISQKPLKRGVFAREVFEPLDSSPPPRLVTRQPRRQQSGRAHSAFQGPVESKHYRR